MDQNVVTPRVLYRGAADETAELCVVDDQAALAVALGDGWRLQRVPPAAAPVEVVDEAPVAVETVEPVADDAGSDAPAAKAKSKAKR